MDANELLMGGGVKAISWKDHQIGHTVIGTIAEEPKAKQMTKYDSTELDFWPSGDPKMQIVVTLATDLRDPGVDDDDGRRALFIEPRMMTPVREAVRAAGAKGLSVGGKLAVRWISGSGEGKGNARQFAAEYQPPQVDPGGLISGGASAQPAAAVAAPPAGGMLGAMGTTTAPPAPAQAGPPPGVDPAVWAGLPDTQRAAILAAMAPTAGTATGFEPKPPF